MVTCEKILNLWNWNSLVRLEPPEDTLFGRRWYGRLADNANVYSQPSQISAVVRNVGDGYLCHCQSLV